MARTPAPVPQFELLTGAVWWTVGATAFDSGGGTVVLAAGLLLAGWLFRMIRSEHGPGVPLSPAGRSRLLRVVFVTVLFAAGISAGLAAVPAPYSYGELAAPVVCVLVGGVLVSLSSLLGARVLVAVGAALMVLGAAGALLALDTPGRLFSQGLVGLGAAALLWLAGAYRTGVLAHLRSGDRSPRAR